MTLEDLLGKLQTQFANKGKLTLEHSQITMELDAADLKECCFTLRDAAEFQFAQLMDLCGVDYLQYGIGEWATNTSTSQGFSRGVDLKGIPSPEADPKQPRFAVVYHLLSVALNQRLRLKVLLANDPPRLPSIIDIWNSANWYEREAFDLFGILFDGHPDLRRILTDYGFIGHPFRKDFPLIGQVEMRYDAAEARVVYEPVSIKPRTLVPKVIRTVHNEEAGS